MTMRSPSDKQRSATATTTAVDGRTARACDSCLRRLARWFCSADDAFLCQSCDTSVHSANPLSRRHHRLRLNNSSPSPTTPAWHHGFNRKPRTPRPKPRLVPELDTSTDDNNEDESQLLYRVPIFDPVMAEFCSPPLDETKPSIQELGPTTPATATNRLVGFLPSEVELAEFSADMESLLGRGLDDDSFCMEELGLVGDNCHAESEQVKVEMADDEIDVDNQMELELKFEYCSSPEMREVAEEASKRVWLRLDYEAVIAEWSTTHSSSPWTNGHRPEFDGWVDFMGMWGGGGVRVGVERNGGREARVTRYREKRRTRLFSKKIRYEVRKLNAEKRPRMKGRFVKRASLATAAAVVVPSAAFPY